VYKALFEAMTRHLGAAISDVALSFSFVAQRDKVGGSGANFIVEWQAKQPVNAPIIPTASLW
jgi:hypothetical protein